MENDEGATVFNGIGDSVDVSGDMSYPPSQIYYCGRDMNQCRCGGCDGQCGPENGCPCNSCKAFFLKTINQHVFNTGMCYICTKCSYCTEYGRNCVKCEAGPRVNDRGKLCGCGMGKAGCTKCGICERCSKEQSICPGASDGSRSSGHEYSRGQCNICTKCSNCTGYGATCVACRNTDRSADRGKPCGCGGGDAGCRRCGMCKKCGDSNDCSGIIPDSSVPSQAALPPPPTENNPHDFQDNYCMICTKCATCTGFGATCVKCEGIDRSSDKGMRCGCGTGSSGCSRCGICKSCGKTDKVCRGTTTTTLPRFLPTISRHDYYMDECRICVKCSACTGYGSTCCECVGKDRSRDKGKVCGCGKGKSGCRHCGICEACGGSGACSGGVTASPVEPSPVHTKHDYYMDECRICVKCSACTGYGSTCCECVGKDRSRDKGKVCGCGKGKSGCRHCGICEACGGSGACSGGVTASPVEPSPVHTKHDYYMDECRICVKCSACTGYGSTCCECVGKDRSRDKGKVCGCGKGKSGCRHCGICEACGGSGACSGGVTASPVEPSAAHRGQNISSDASLKQKSESIAAKVTPSGDSKQSVSSGYSRQEVDSECCICFDKPRNATIVHGETGHICCCYDCAKDLERSGGTCPLCRQRITLVVKNFTA